MIDDLRYALRALARQPAFTLLVTLTLALGIGANIATFSVAHGALFRPLPMQDPDSLYTIWEDATHYGFPDNSPAPANFVDWRARSRSFAGMAAISIDRLNLTGSGEAEQIGTGTVTGDFFPVLGVDAGRGRLLSPSDDRPEAPRVVVLSSRLWQRRFGGDPAVLGKTIVLNGAPRTVVGILPESFWFLTRDLDLWVPFAGSAEEWANREDHFLEVVGRLRPGIAPQAAQAEMQMIARSLEAAYPKTNKELGARIVPLRSRMFGEVRPVLLALLAAVGLVLLIACVNVANLLLARASTRRREMAVRRALGAGWGRIARLLLTESLVLAALGGIAGLVVAAWGVEGLGVLLPEVLVHAGGAAPRMSVVLFALVLTLATGILFGLAPALRGPRGDLTLSLNATGRVVEGDGRLRQALVVGEVALCLCLLVAGGLILRSLDRILAQGIGFRPEGTLTLRTNLTPDRYGSVPARLAFYERVLEQVRALPGVTAAGYTSHLPLTWGGDNNTYLVEGQPLPEPGQEQIVSLRVITPEYFRALGTPLRGGREFNAGDTPGSAGVVIINQAFAARHFPGGDALGRRLQRGNKISPDYWLTIVGVAADAHQSTLETAPKPEIYLPHTQFRGLWAAPRELVIRSAADPLTLAPEVTAIIHGVDPDQPVSQVRTMEAVVGATLVTRRLQAGLFGGFAVLGLALASIGLYGVLSYTVARRTQEIGVRMALGAPPRRVLGMVVGSGLRLVGLGLTLGLAGAVVTARLLRGLLFGVPSGDPVTFLVSAVLLGLVALVACYLPARRAARVDPLVALRVE